MNNHMHGFLKCFELFAMQEMYTEVTNNLQTLTTCNLLCATEFKKNGSYL